jgi:predicted transcriptional regulator
VVREFEPTKEMRGRPSRHAGVRVGYARLAEVVREQTEMQTRQAVVAERIKMGDAAYLDPATGLIRRAPPDERSVAWAEETFAKGETVVFDPVKGVLRRKASAKPKSHK